MPTKRRRRCVQKALRKMIRLPGAFKPPAPNTGQAARGCATVLQEKIRAVKNCRRKNLTRVGKSQLLRWDKRAELQGTAGASPATQSRADPALGTRLAEGCGLSGEKGKAPGEARPPAGLVARVGLCGGKGRLIPGSAAVPMPARRLRPCLPSQGSRRSRPTALLARAGPPSPAQPYRAPGRPRRPPRSQDSR